VKVMIDDQVYEPQVNPSQPLADLVQEVRERRSDTGRIVVGICCDGRDITGDTFDQDMARPLRSYQQVDLHTDHPRHLVEEAMAQAEQMLADADRDRSQVVESLTAGKTAEGIETLGGCMQAWHQVHHGIINALALLNIKPEELSVGGRSLPEALQGLRHQLAQLKEALEARDYVLLADTLQYEFDAVRESWSAVVEAIRARTPAE
jgi:hypothetical protein